MLAKWIPHFGEVRGEEYNLQFKLKTDLITSWLYPGDQWQDLQVTTGLLSNFLFAFGLVPEN